MPADQQLSSLYSRSSRTCCDQPTDVLRARRFAAFTLRESTKAAGECSHMNPDWRRLGPQNSLMSIHEAPDRSADTNTTARRAYDSFTGPVTLLSIALGAWDANGLVRKVSGVPQLCAGGITIVQNDQKS